VSARSRALAERRLQLQLRCATQRQHFANEARSIEQRLRSIDRIAVMLRRALAEPLVIVAAVAGVVLVGPMRVMRNIGRVLLVAEALRRLWPLLKR
jgi:hypothetical protein